MASALSSPSSSQQDLGISEAPTPEPDLSDLPELVPDYPTNVSLPPHRRSRRNIGGPLRAEMQRSDVSVHVVGNASVKVPADRATLRVALTKISKDKEATIKAVSDAAGRLEGLLKKLKEGESPSGSRNPFMAISPSTSRPGTSASQSSPCTSYSTTGLYTHSYYAAPGTLSARYVVSPSSQTQQEPILTHTTTLNFIAIFSPDPSTSSFNSLSSLCSKLSTYPDTQIQSLSWSLAPETTARHQAQVRTQAIRDADSQAQDYARALGCSGKCRPVEVAGPGAGNAVQQPFSFGSTTQPVSGLFGQSNAAGQPPSLNFEPDVLDIACAVSVRYEVALD